MHATMIQENALARADPEGGPKGPNPSPLSFFYNPLNLNVLDQLGVPSDNFAICPCISG